MKMKDDLEAGMEKIIEETASYPTRLLDASAMGAPVYRRLGFQDMYTVSRIALAGNFAAPELAWEKMTETEAKTLLP